MLRQTSLLVSLVLLIDRLPWPSAPVKRPRGRPTTYSDRLILKALVIMIIRRLYTAYALLTFLDQEDAVAQQLRALAGQPPGIAAEFLEGLPSNLISYLTPLLDADAAKNAAVAWDDDAVLQQWSASLPGNAALSRHG